MGLDGGGGEIEAALFAEGCVARDDGFSDFEAGDFVGDDFFGVGERFREFSAQSNQQGAEVFRSLSDVGVVISRHV